MSNQERKKAIKLLSLEVLSRRVVTHHRNRPLILEDTRKAIAGFRGEQAVDYYLNILPKERYIILHDLRLQVNKGLYFQIDTLLLSQYFLVILEIKNIAGSLFFEEHPRQLTRTFNEKEEAFKDPISQVKLQRVLLQTWLNNFGLPPIPIHPLIIISNPSTIVKASLNYHEFQQSVTHAANLPFKIQQLENLNKVEKWSSKDMKKLSRLIKKHDQPLEKNVLQIYDVSEGELIKGVHCKNCSYIPMARIRGSWSCPNCFQFAKYSHIESIIDYVLLLGPIMTNKKLRSFLKLRSPTVANKILTSLNFKQIGDRKARYYSIPPQFLNSYRNTE